MKSLALAAIFATATLFPVLANAQSPSCTGPGDTSCGIGNICQQGTNGFYACFPAPAASGSCTGPSDTSCGSGNSCQQGINGFYGCFPNANASSGLSGSGTGITGSQNTGTGVTGSQNTGTGITGSNGTTLYNPLQGQGNLQSFLMSILGFVIKIGVVVVVLMLVYVGFLFTTAQGEPAKISKAREAFLWTIVGALILLGAQAIASGIQATANAL